MNGTTIDGEELAAHIAIQRAMKKRGTRRLISFHSRVKHAEQFSKNVPVVADWLRANRRSRSRMFGLRPSRVRCRS